MKQGGVSFLGLLAIVFITLKLCSVINWSWWWVLSPLWGGVAIALIVISILLLIVGIAKLTTQKEKRELLKKRIEEVNQKPKSRFKQRLDEVTNQR